MKGDFELPAFTFCWLPKIFGDTPGVIPFILIKLDYFLGLLGVPTL
jgi:hypothetical protein